MARPMRTERVRTTLNRALLVLALMGASTPGAGAGNGLLGLGGGAGAGGVTASGNDGVGGIERQLGNKKPAASSNTGSVVSLPKGWTPMLPTPPSVHLSTNGWIDLGHGLPGPDGRLGLGLLAHDELPGVRALWISGGPAGASGWLTLGRSTALRPFHGGVLVPTPDALVPVQLDAEGNAMVTLVTSLFGLPTVLYGQAWFPTAGRSQGFCATNGLGLLSL